MEIDQDDFNENKDVTTAETILSASSNSRNGEYQQHQQQQAQILANGLQLHGLHYQIQEPQIPAPSLAPTLSNGISVGIQSDKVIELSPYTRLISANNGRHNILHHAAWSRSNAYTSNSETALLAVGGKQFGQIWAVDNMEIRGTERGALSSSPSPYPNHRYSRNVIHPQSIIDLDIGYSQTLISLAWSPVAVKVAFSTFCDDPEGTQRSTIGTRSILSDTDGETYTSVPDAVTNLVWNSTGRYVAGLSSTSVIMLDTKTGIQLRPLDLERTLFDATWLDPETLVVCGDSTIIAVVVSSGSIRISRVFGELAGSTEWTKVRYNTALHSFAIVSETTGDLAVVEPTVMTHKEIHAHSPGIIDLVYEVYSHEYQESLLITSAVDGSIKFWSLGGGISLVQTLHMGGISQALTLSFSPDQTLLAVADWYKVLFWDIRQTAQLKYKWELRRMDWQSLPNGHKPNGVPHDHDMTMIEADDEAPILLWDSLGSMLTFAHKDKVISPAYQ